MVFQPKVVQTTLTLTRIFMINFDNGSTVLKRMLKYLPLEWSTISGFIRVGFSLACNYKTRVELIGVQTF